MKKLAVVLGVAAVATFTGCRDQDYDAKHGKQVQDEVKSVETTPAEVTTTKTVETTTVTTTEIKTEPKCMCAPGTKHTVPCACGASDCKCIVVKPQPVEPETTVYIVQNGDYLAKISKKYNVTINSIKRINNLKSDNIRVGQKLKLPGKIDVGVQTVPVSTTTKKHGTIKRTSFTPYTGATKEYVVKNGDTLGSVAYGNGLNIRQLKQLNNLTSDSLKIGQKLKVPAEKVTKPTGKTDPANVGTKQLEPVKPVEPAKDEKSVAPVTTEPIAQTPVAPTTETTPAPAPSEVAPATTAETTSASAQTAPATTTYVVQEGEDLTRLAVDFGVTPTVIRELNNLGENDTIKPGQVLKLPAEAQQ